MSVGRSWSLRVVGRTDLDFGDDYRRYLTRMVPCIVLEDCPVEVER